MPAEALCAQLIFAIRLAFMLLADFHFRCCHFRRYFRRRCRRCRHFEIFRFRLTLIISFTAASILPDFRQLFHFDATRFRFDTPLAFFTLSADSCALSAFADSHQLAFFAILSDADISQAATTPPRHADTRLFSPPYCHATPAAIAAADISPLFSLRLASLFSLIIADIFTYAAFGAAISRASRRLPLATSFR
jgi:hypothetical protein